MKLRLRTAVFAMSCIATSAAAHADTVAPADTQRDRAAILSMQGEYIVDFAFDETVLLKPDYERAPAMRSGWPAASLVAR